MENDYKYLLQVGFFNDEEDEQFNIDFDMAVDEVTSTGLFCCEICQKKYKTAGGLKRHNKKKHSKVTDFRFDLDLLEELLAQSIETASKDLCLKVERRNCISKFVYQKEEILQLFEEIHKICKDFHESKDPEKFFANYFSNVTARAKSFFPNHPPVSSTTLMMQLGERIFTQLNKTEVIERRPTPISEKEMDGLNYLAGYVVQKLLKKIRNHHDYQSIENQAVIAILEGAIEKNGTNDFINTLSRGGLVTVTEHCLRIFYKAEEEFRRATEVDHLRKIDVGNISEKVMNDSDIISLFAVVSDGTNIQNEIKENILEKMLQLYLRVRSFSFAKDVTAKQKKLHAQEKAKNKGLRKEIKKSMEQLDSSTHM